MAFADELRLGMSVTLVLAEGPGVLGEAAQQKVTCLGDLIGRQEEPRTNRTVGVDVSYTHLTLPTIYSV